MGGHKNTATILVVDDEPQVADAYELRVGSRYETRVAYCGQEALEKVDEAVDVVLLDRRMPDISGDEVLNRIRKAGIDCRVILVTAVEPDFDILELPLDDYLHKPVSGEDLVEAIDRQVTASDYDEPVEQFVELSSKIDVLETKRSEAELEASPEIQRLKEQVDKLETRLDVPVSKLRAN